MLAIGSRSLLDCCAERCRDTRPG